MTTEPTLGRALDAWATTEPEGAGDSAALARILAHADAVATQSADAPGPKAGSGPFRKPGWMLGGALAASLAVAVLLAPRPGAAPAPADGGNQGGAPVMLAEADGGENAAFALLYTPTVEEEYQL
jgi:hypothetical protein